MTQADVTSYRRLIRQQDANKDPLVMIKVQDLRALLDCFEWYADNKPRVRRQAIKETTP